MPKGSAFVSVAQYYGAQYRPNPKRRVGGSVDWFPPAIDWVRTTYYEDISADEVVRDINVVTHNRNAEFSVNVNLEKMGPMIDEAIAFVRSGKEKSDKHGYSTTGLVCKKLFSAEPTTTIEPVLARRCPFAFSFFCEMVANSPASERGKHYRYKRGCYQGEVDESYRR
eukprot:PhF_6_TR37688/c0_g1_i1/m.56094